MTAYKSVHGEHATDTVINTKMDTQTPQNPNQEEIRPGEEYFEKYSEKLYAEAMTKNIMWEMAQNNPIVFAKNLKNTTITQRVDLNIEALYQQKRALWGELNEEGQRVVFQQVEEDVIRATPQSREDITELMGKSLKKRAREYLKNKGLNKKKVVINNPRPIMPPNECMNLLNMVTERMIRAHASPTSQYHQSELFEKKGDGSIVPIETEVVKVFNEVNRMNSQSKEEAIRNIDSVLKNNYGIIIPGISVTRQEIFGDDLTDEVGLPRNAVPNKSGFDPLKPKHHAREFKKPSLASKVIESLKNPITTIKYIWNDPKKRFKWGLVGAGIGLAGIITYSLFPNEEVKSLKTAVQPEYTAVQVKEERTNINQLEEIVVISEPKPVKEVKLEPGVDPVKEPKDVVEDYKEPEKPKDIGDMADKGIIRNREDIRLLTKVVSINIDNTEKLRKEVETLRKDYQELTDDYKESAVVEKVKPEPIIYNPIQPAPEFQKTPIQLAPASGKSTQKPVEQPRNPLPLRAPNPYTLKIAPYAGMKYALSSEDTPDPMPVFGVEIGVEKENGSIYLGIERGEMDANETTPEGYLDLKSTATTFMVGGKLSSNKERKLVGNVSAGLRVTREENKITGRVRDYDVDDSKKETIFGAEVGAGLEYRLNNRVSLTAGAVYGHNFADDNSNVTDDLTARAGVTVKF